MRLNVGCGDHPAAGWVNVDLCRMPDGPQPDVIASVLALPFPDASAERIYCGHLLEHLDYEFELPVALAELHRVLTGDGTLMVVGPDADRARERWPGMLEQIIGGEGRWPGDEHRWTATEGLTADALTDAGFVVGSRDIAGLENEWPVTSRVGWQFAVRGCK